MRPGGLHVYDGHNRHEDPAEWTAAVNALLEPVLTFRTQLEKRGLPVPRLVLEPLTASSLAADELELRLGERVLGRGRASSTSDDALLLACFHVLMDNAERLVTLERIEADLELVRRRRPMLVRQAMHVVESLVSFEQVLDIPAVWMHTMPGFDTAVFPYTTDVPLLTRWGKPLLIGPGSIHVAHTDEEHLAIDEMMAGIQLYESLARKLLSA